MAQFEIGTSGSLIWLAFRGTVTMSDFREADHAFWNTRRATHDRILMIYLDVTCIDVDAQAFTAAGLTDQSRLRPALDVRAAYVADTPQVFGFMRIIESVWNSHLDVQVFQALPPALDWLQGSAADLHAMNPGLRQAAG